MTDIENKIMDCARMILAQDGYLAPMAFECATMVPIQLDFSTDEDKFYSLTKLGYAAYMAKVPALYILSNGAMRRFKDDKEVSYVLENWDTEQPDTYPQKMRTEAIVLWKLTFPDTLAVHVLEYTMDDKKYLFKDLFSVDSAIRSDFTEMVKMGWKKAQKEKT